MSNWISVKNEIPERLLLDVWVEVKPSGYHGRLIDCYFDFGKWKDKEGDLDSIFQDAVTHFMISPEPPKIKG